MKKLIHILSAASLFGCIIFLESCRREVIPRDRSFDVAIAKINTWLDGQKQGKPAYKAANIELLKKNLLFSRLRFERSVSEEQFLIIPISENFKAGVEIDKNTACDLLLFMNQSGNIRSGAVVLYTARQGTAQDIPVNAFSDIFGTARPECDGKFQFLSISGTPQYELIYKDKHLISSGAYQRKPSTARSTSTATTACYDWYLVTTWYDPSGNVADRTYVYLYTTCGVCGSPKYMTLCSTDEESGSSGCCISDPSAKLSVRGFFDPGVDACSMETVDPVTGLHTKNCTHSWYFVTNTLMWYVWKYGSVEQSLEAREAGIWTFKSVAHQGMLTSGTVPPCISSSCNIGSAIASYSGNTARMNLIYSQNISIACRVPGGLISGSSTASTQWLAR